MTGLHLGASILLLAMLVSGCGFHEKSITVRGRVTDGGTPLKSTPVLGRVRVQFILQTGVPKQLVDPKDALVDQDTGTFEVQVLAGKYRIAVYHLDPIPKDKLRGRFDAKNSPVIEDIGPDTKEIVIDVRKKS